MFLKRIKINLFGKIFCFSVFIISITLLINYIINAIFLEKFYIYRKKELMLNMVEKAKVIYLNDSQEEFENFVFDVKESKGIEIDINSTRSRHHMMSGRMMSRNIRNIPYDEFVDKEFIGNDARILYYKVKLSSHKEMILSTSLSIIQAHSHESNIFNIITAFFALSFSLVAGILFSKRISRDIIYLSEKADKIAKLNFPKSIEVERNDEIGDLSRSLDKMSHELSSSIGNLKSFVSNASHELRTPIGVICAHADALLKNRNLNNENQREYYEIIFKVGNDMKELVENLLILSKLENIVFKLKKENINLEDIVENALEKYDIFELEKDITVNLDIKTKNIVNDSRVIKLVINNLIENALKYSIPKGNIYIYEKEEFLYIENHFLGNIEEKVEQLIQPFSRGKSAEDYEYDGIGLGLSIVSKALKLAFIDYSIDIIQDKFIFKLKIF